jgi:protein-tyrosine phosphatase
MKILFVCTGNICRSPTAEAVFRHLANEEELGGTVHVDSAGTHSYHVGEPPDDRSAETAELRGYSMAGQTARRVTAQDFDSFDLILAMDRGHLRILEGMAPPHAADKVRLFLDFAPGAGLSDVPDPYYGGAQGFEQVLDLIEAASRGVLAHVVAGAAAR